MVKGGDKKRGRHSGGGENSQVGKPDNSASNLTITDPKIWNVTTLSCHWGRGPSRMSWVLVSHLSCASEPHCWPAATGDMAPGSAASLSAGHDQSEAAGQLSDDDELDDNSTSASEESLEMPRRLTRSQNFDLRSNSDCKQLAGTALKFVETRIPPSSN